jgi:peptidoglycan/xylan/chitin deacetylase (PgdA/CDA1 family)
MLRGFTHLLALSALAFACSAAQAQSSYQPAPPASDQSAQVFKQLLQDWAHNLYEKQIDASVAEYTPDADFVQPDGGIVHGTAALRKLYETITAAYDSDLVFNSTHLDIAGDLATDSGTYREILVERTTGKRLLHSGAYRTVYHRTSDGHWLIARQEWPAETEAPVAINLDPHPIVALTFDDLPAAGRLPPDQNRTKILTALAAELKANHLEGTYGFVNAVKLENDPDAQQALHIWLDAGMNIGSHTWSHMSLTTNTAEAFEQEIAKNEPAVETYGQTRDWRWFRYPFLWEGDTLEKRRAVRNYLAEHRYRVAQVSIDFEDYAWNDAYGRCSAKQDTAAIDWLKQSYLEAAREYLSLGREEQIIAFGHEIPNVLLLHATAFTTLMLPELLDQLRSEGFTFNALADVEKDPAYANDPDAALKYGGTLPDQFMDSRHLTYPPFQPKPFDKLKTICQ